MVDVAITASNRAAGIQRWLPPAGPLANAAARQLDGLPNWRAAFNRPFDEVAEGARPRE
jgi:hypothetical protein